MSSTSHINLGFPSVPADAPSATGSAVDQIVHEIRGMISEEGLTVGDKLPTERELCARFNASRNTVREAVRMLKAYGIVDVRPKVGATIVDNRMTRALDLFSFNVGEISEKTFNDVQGFRELIETGGFQAVLDAVTPEHIAALRASNEAMATAPNVVEASEHDFAFHMGLVSLLDNQTIVDVYQVMKPVILRIMQRGKNRRVLEGQTKREHEGIIQTLEARDSLAFQYLMRVHLRGGLFLYKRDE